MLHVSLEIFRLMIGVAEVSVAAFAVLDCLGMLASAA